MARLQPEIIVARLSTHLTSKAAVDTTYLKPNKPRSRDRVSKDLVSRQYDIWTSSSSWMRFLIGQFEFQSWVRTCKGRERQEFYAQIQVPRIDIELSDRLSGISQSLWMVLKPTNLPRPDKGIKILQSGNTRPYFKSSAYATGEASNGYR